MKQLGIGYKFFIFCIGLSVRGVNEAIDNGLCWF